MADWHIASVEITGGFLPGLKLTIPVGLTCIIGPRGSGKSTFVEAIRFAVLGGDRSTRFQNDLVKANLGNALILLRTDSPNGDRAYSIQRSLHDGVALSAADGRALPHVDLDRGTFLPLDAYSSGEIELIAEESFGQMRRALLDELRRDELTEITSRVNDLRRSLEANADRIRECENHIADLTEHTEGLADANAKLECLPNPQDSKTAKQLVAVTEAERRIASDAEAIERTVVELAAYEGDLAELTAKYSKALHPDEVMDSPVADIVRDAHTLLAELFESVDQKMRAIGSELCQARERLEMLKPLIATVHEEKRAELAKLQAADHQASLVVAARADAERDVARLVGIEHSLREAREQLKNLNEERKRIKGDYLLEREKASTIRHEVADQLSKDAGTSVRIRVLQNADSLEYQGLLAGGLKGARVRNHEDIVDKLLRVRPEHLAQLVRDQDYEGFESEIGLGPERSKRVLEAFGENLDPFGLELAEIGDQVRIELNVGTPESPHFKEASELSRGQRCTALLPILLARRDVPLIIDQPEDNLDNHFIFNTIIEAVCRLKTRRQMIFVTHNANIPVLGEADLVVVMGSDGSAGFVEKSGSLDECRDEIVDLLEGGEEAFELRRQRYAK